jgi:hypothetical protein
MPPLGGNWVVLPMRGLAFHRIVDCGTPQTRAGRKDGRNPSATRPAAAVHQGRLSGLMMSIQQRREP